MSANPALAAPAFIRPAATPLESAVARAINPRYLADETDCVRELIELARLDPATRDEQLRSCEALLVLTRL